MSRLTTLKKIAIKADGSDFTVLKQLALTVMDAKEIFNDHGATALLTPDGTLLELYTSYACFPEYLFSAGNVVISYKVEDLNTAIDMAAKAGAEILTKIITVGSVMCYCHLKLPGGTIIGLYQENLNESL